MKYQLTTEQADEARRLFLKVRVVQLGAFEMDSHEEVGLIKEFYDELVDELETHMESCGIPADKVRGSQLTRDGDYCYLEVSDGAIKNSFDA